MIRWVVLGVLTAIAFVNVKPAAASNQAKDLDGAWFSCEFAHSQLAPEDGCKMLDDDGFLIAGNTIDHIKVSDSKESACRHERTGNCFRRDQSKVTVIRDSTGSFLPTADGFQISYWGCAQDYKMDRRDDYFEIGPIGDLCFWTSDKRYFLARYTGDLEFAPEDTGFSMFSSER